MSSEGQDSSISAETFGQNASIKLPRLIGSMSISPSGRDVVLASKEGLHIIDLDAPYSPPRFLPHRTPWEVADVQWSPFADRDYWVVSTSNQKALVWNLAAVGLRNSIQHVLHGHTRAITDINFSAHHLDKLATCAVDSFVHCWDLRCPARPINSFSDWFAGATQVKWSRQDEHVLASSHDKFLHIWDDRKGAYPARTFEAHEAKIYGIDWNRFEPSKIVTCSLDKTVKFWDTNNDQNSPDRTIETSFPVWRARHTPFGWGLMVMPQRGNGDLHLYDRRPVDGVLENGRVEAVHVFEGHKDQVKEFLWRPSGTVVDGIDHRDFQLVSWGTDRDLKLHAVPKSTFAKIGYEKGVSKPHRLRNTRRGARNRTFRDEPIISDIVTNTISRTDSFPAQSQFLRARGRPSTNVGMSRFPVTQFKGWLHAGKQGRRTDMQGKGISRPDTDPIAWMRNVKIADPLADEITQVGEKFSKIDFETVNVTQRRATMTLQSSWGESAASSAYTRLDFKFPKGYPKSVPAIVYVAKTNSIGSETQKKLSADIHKIAEVHAQRGRGCIEAVVRFLLRDQTLEQVISWVTRDSLSDSKLIDTTSDLPQDASDDSDDDQIDPLPNVTNSNANVRVPLAKGCAGLWAENGKLVCFFVVKDKEPSSFLGTLGTGRLDDSESSKLFGGFGKFQADSPSRKTKEPRLAQDDSDSDSTENSSLTSSSVASSTSSIGFEERARFVPWQRTMLDSLQRGKSADGSQRSTTLDGTKPGELVKANVVSIHDLSDLLPAKQSLAQEYKICGDTWAVCQHNAEVATRYTLLENAALWRIAANILVPTIAQNDTQNEAEYLSLVRRFSSERSGNAVVLSTGSLKDDGTSLQSHSTANILGQTYLIPAMMQYLDKLCDIQMLAMLSAIFLQTKRSAFESLIRIQAQARQNSIAITSSLGTDDGTTHLQLDPTDSRFGGIRHGATFHVHQPSFEHISQVSGNRIEMSTSVPTSTMYTGYVDSTRSSSGAPSVVAHDPSGVVSAIHSTVVSVAGSPENHRLSRRSEGAVAFPTATASLYALTRSRPPSPPSASTANRESARGHRSSKSLRASPDDSFFNDARSRLKSSLSLINVSGFDEDTNQSRSDPQRLKPILKNGKKGMPQQRSKKRLRTRFSYPSNVQMGQSAPVTELIDTARSCLCHIEQYLKMLEVWQLWVERSEMQNILSDTISILEKLEPDKTLSTNRSEPSKGLEIRRCCPECERPLAAIEKNGVAIGWHCVSSNCTARNTRSAKKQRCSICDTISNGLSIPCLQCGHLTCYNCAQVWFAKQLGEDRKDSVNSFKSVGDETELTRNELTCPSGCGCSCPTLSTIDVPDAWMAVGSEIQLNPTPSTPHSEGYQEAVSRTPAANEHRMQRGQSVHGPESALNALLALNLSSRHRSMSSTQPVVSTTTSTPQNGPALHKTTSRTRENSVSIPDELLPWATDKNATLSRGLGGGLSRGLSNKGSDATIRRSGR